MSDGAGNGTRERKQVPLEFEPDLLERIDLYRAGQLNEKGKPMSRQALVMALLEDALRLRQGGGTMPAPAPVVVDVPNVDEIAAAVVARLPVMPVARPLPSNATLDTVDDDDLVMQALGTVYLHVLAVEHMLADEWEQAWVTLDRKGKPQAGAGQRLRQDATEKAQAEMKERG